MDLKSADQFVKLGQSGAEPGRKQFIDPVDALQTENCQCVVVWEIPRLARLGSIYQRVFEHCEDTGTTVIITDGWVDEVRRDGTGRLIADISTTVAEKERRRLTKPIQAGIDHAQREASGLEPSPSFRPDDGHL
ncbi:recombinase family protein [Halococcus agarilyticus]|uniref:recombinase family protein n=1 Tax=Halococcus agarilyticus TaxID=1232219 RepID=UPI00373AF238